MSTKKYISYDGLGLYDENIKSVIITKASTALTLAKRYTDEKIEEVSGIDTSNIYTKTEVDKALSDKSDANHNHDEKYDVLGSADKALEDANAYTDTKISELASNTVIDDKISIHNTSTSAHNDIRKSITDLTNKLNNFLDVDDTSVDQLSEILSIIETLKSDVDNQKNNVNEVISSEEPTNQNAGDCWMLAY